MKLLKEVVKKGEKKYTNYILVIGGARIPIEVKTFGKAWNDPSIRKAYTLLSLASELVVKD